MKYIIDFYPLAKCPACYQKGQYFLQTSKIGTVGRWIVDATCVIVPILQKQQRQMIFVVASTYDVLYIISALT